MTARTLHATIKWRRNDKATWESDNPVLEEGEAGVEFGNVVKIKVGDGATPWNALPYISAEDEYYFGSSSVSSLVNIPVSRGMVVANVSAATTLSLASPLVAGKTLIIKVYNSTASTITQPLPTTGSFESKDNDGSDISSVEIPANGNMEINIISTGTKYIIKTDV